MDIQSIKNRFGIMGNSPALNYALQVAAQVANTDLTVLISGESGVGKEAFSSIIHTLSSRKHNPFIAVNCGAIPEGTIDSELFGHEKGSFTGALNQKIGSFEIANGGTIFLDEVANLSYDIQVSLLRVVQERKMRRVGGTKDIDLDVRIIVASNERLWSSEKKGKFREDLFHRFNEFSIEVPPLRERREDILLFANHFLVLTNKELDKHIKGFTQETEKALKSYSWPGNLRELKNVIKRATLLTDSNYIEIHSLPFEISNFNKLQFEQSQEEANKQEEAIVSQVPEMSEPAPVAVGSGEYNLASRTGIT